MHDVGPARRSLPAVEEDTPHRLLSYRVPSRMSGKNIDRRQLLLNYAQTYRIIRTCRMVKPTSGYIRLFAGALVRQPDGRLSKKVMFRDIVGGGRPRQRVPGTSIDICLSVWIHTRTKSPTALFTVV